MAHILSHGAETLAVGIVARALVALVVRALDLRSVEVRVRLKIKRGI